ncbi:hypothetical protein [Sinomicrobium weinanense]|uniref:Uncharacterized protein n=1 Tax=Sinomicrobium weinanense TaxID=2842200 RepID=A0A926JTR7_9FLAO|nr:hypothetical protein [Sinomicrobium weinanense]MBC9797372.1 hypothetical protein [Sinomicrobium weinanense]MBU3123397.1 hypothetical protein [Sinomicrobium weinanense]
MSAKNQRILYFILILIGGALVFTEQGKENREDPYLLILGFVLLMFGLYKATTRWVRDNPKENSSNDPGGEEETGNDRWKSNGEDREKDKTT